MKIYHLIVCLVIFFLVSCAADYDSQKHFDVISTSSYLTVFTDASGDDFIDFDPESLVIEDFDYSDTVSLFLNEKVDSSNISQSRQIRINITKEIWNTSAAGSIPEYGIWIDGNNSYIRYGGGFSSYQIDPYHKLLEFNSSGLKGRLMISHEESGTIVPLSNRTDLDWGKTGILLDDEIKLILDQSQSDGRVTYMDAKSFEDGSIAFSGVAKGNFNPDLYGMEHAVNLEKTTPFLALYDEDFQLTNVHYYESDYDWKVRENTYDQMTGLHDVKVYSKNEIIIISKFTGEITLDGKSFSSLTEYTDHFIARWHGENGIQFITRYGGILSDGYEKSIILEDGSILLSGDVNRDAYTWDPEEEPMEWVWANALGMIMRISPEGNILWNRIVQGKGWTDTIQFDIKDNNIIAVGTSRGSFDRDWSEKNDWSDPKYVGKYYFELGLDGSPLTAPEPLSFNNNSYYLQDVATHDMKHFLILERQFIDEKADMGQPYRHEHFMSDEFLYEKRTWHTSFSFYKNKEIIKDFNLFAHGAKIIASGDNYWAVAVQGLTSLNISKETVQPQNLSLIPTGLYPWTAIMTVYQFNQNGNILKQINTIVPQADWQNVDIFETGSAMIIIGSINTDMESNINPSVEYDYSPGNQTRTVILIIPRQNQ